jgi:hypothetical protein
MLKRFRKFVELPWSEQLLFSEAYFLQLATGLLLKVVPFKWIPRLFAGKGESRPPLPRLRRARKAKGKSISSQERGTRNKEQGTIEQIKTAIQRSSPYSLWKNKCLISSLAARRMLNRRNIQSEISLGVAKDLSGKTIAHAWLKVGDFEIVEKSGDYHELYLF